MKANAYRDQTVEELQARVSDLRQSLFNLRTRTATGEMKNVSQIRHEKRELACVLTIIREKEVAVAASA
jgi:large subunit ribosomal protein L29